jgi:ABC-2 type transport system permease protein
MNSRLLALIRKEFIQISRDRRTLTLILIIPIMQLFLLGYAATNDVRNVVLAVYDQSRSPESRALLDAYRAADYFKLTYSVESEAEVYQLIENGAAKAGVIIPPDYALRVEDDSAQVAFILDGSDPTVASTALSAAQFIGQNYSTKIQAKEIEAMGQGFRFKTPIQVRTMVWYNPDLISAYFMIPGVIGTILFALTAILTATAVVRERERGTIEQLIVTPIRPWELVVGKILPYSILSLLDALEVLYIGHWWFGVPIRGLIVLVILLSAVFLLTSLGIGLFASTVAQTQQEAMLIVWMTLLPSIFLSGFFFPLEAMPYALQIISLFSPLRYYLVAIRALMLKGAGLIVIQEQLLALALFGLVIMGGAAQRFRKTLD